MQSRYKPCPFCGSFPSIEFDAATGQYKLECKRCKSDNIVYYCLADTIDEVTERWNKRTKAEIQEDNVTVQDTYGFLIFPDGEIVLCNMYNHQEIIMQRFNINESKETFDHGKFCSEHSIVRISIFNNSIAIDLPLQTTKKQLDNIFEALIVYPKLKSTDKFSLFSYKTGSYLLFYTLEELLEEIHAI